MSDSTTADNTVLVLYPPMVSGQTSHVIGAQIGVPLVAYDLVTDGLGAQVIVDPPLSGTVDVGDVLALWLQGEAAALDIETIQDRNVMPLLRIPRGRLHPDRVNNLYYTIERNSQNIGTSEPLLPVLYNRIRPGFKDEMTVPGGHSELVLQLPDAIKNGVGPDFVSAQVCVSYPYCRAYDTITISCNGETRKASVRADEAPQPPNPGSEIPITVCFTVDRDFLDEAKRLDGKLNFRFTVTDQILNGPDTNEPWSPIQTVDEDLDGKRLPMPILLERLEDFPGDDASIIDLEKLAGNPLLLVVLTTDNRFQVGDTVTATYTAKRPGQPDIVVTVSGPVEADPFGVKKTCVLNIANNQVIADSTVAVTYELRRPNTDLVGTSQIATARVTGSATITLQPPFLVSPAVSPIDVLHYAEGVTLRIEYPGALDGDRARLVEVDAPAGTPQFPLVAFNANKRVNVVLSPAYLAARHGKALEFRWNLNRGGGQAAKSPPLDVSVMKIADGDVRLPKPVIPQAAVNEDVLDLTVFSGDAQITVAKTSLLTIGQLAWLRVYCTLENGSHHIIRLIEARPLTENETTNGFDETFIRRDLDSLKNNTEVRIELKVSLDSNNEEESAMNFPKKTYNVKKTVLEHEGFDGTSDNQPVPAGVIFNRPLLTILFNPGPSPSEASFITDDSTPPFLTGKILQWLDGTIELSLKEPADSVQLGYVVQSGGCHIEYLDNSGVRLLREELKTTGSHQGQWSKCVAPTNKKIKKIIISNNPTLKYYRIFIDNITIGLS